MSTTLPCRLPLLSRKYVALSFVAAAASLLTGSASAQSASLDADSSPAGVFFGGRVPTLPQTGHPLGQPLLAELESKSFAAGETTDRLPDAPSAASSSSSSSRLPEPGTSAVASADSSNAGRQYPKAAQPTDITVLPGQIAPRQTVRDKLVGSMRDAISPFTLGGELISAGYSQATNGSPNYGTDATAFAQRFGAAVARGTSQNLFHEGAMAAILHEDPRYYQMGNGHAFIKRLAYASTRPLITRTDGGKSTPNVALLSGYLGAAALTKVYYPQLNQGFDQTMITYGGSIGGAAVGYIVSEFLSDALQIVHLKKAD